MDRWGRSDPGKECNMLEEDGAEVTCQDSMAAFVIQPYEIKTWKVRFR